MTFFVSAMSALNGTRQTEILPPISESARLLLVKKLSHVHNRDIVPPEIRIIGAVKIHRMAHIYGESWRLEMG